MRAGRAPQARTPMRPGAGTLRSLRRGALALAAGALAALLGGLGLAAPLDDLLQRGLSPTSAPQPSAPGVVLAIGPDDPWPWPNGRLAQLLDRLRDAGARGIALDLPLQASADDPAGDARLARSLLDNRVALGVALDMAPGKAPRARMPPVEFADAARLGHAHLAADRDGRVRQHLSYVLAVDGVRWPSLPQVLVQPGNRAGGGARALDRWRIGHAGGLPPTLPASGVLDGRLGASQLHGRWILVGLADPRLQPRLPGPFGSAPLYPVEHQARALVALLRGATPRPLPAAAQAVLALLLAGGAVLVGLSAGGRDWRLPAAAIGGLVATLGLFAWLLGRQLWFAPGGVVLVLAIVLLAWWLTALWKLLRERQQAPGLASRARMEAALHAVRATGQPHALLLVGIAAGDTRSEAGQADACRLARLLRERARRPGDIAACLGDGAFALLLPGTPTSAAEHILDEIRQLAGRGMASPVRGSVHGCDGDPCECGRRLGAGATAAGAPLA